MTPASAEHNSRAAITAIVLACAAVVVFLPGGFSRWTLPKLTLAVIAAAVAAFAPRTGRLPRWAWIVGGSTVGVLLLSTALSGDPAGLWGRWPRYNGPLLALPVGLAMVWLGAVLLGPAAPALLQRCFRASLSAAAILVAGVAAMESLGLRPIPSDLGRPGSLLGNASDQAVIGVMVAAMLTVWLSVKKDLGPNGWERWLAWAGAVAAVVSVALAGSRAGYVGLAVALGLVPRFLPHNSGARPRRAGRGPVWLAPVVLAALATGLVLANPGARGRIDGSDAVAVQSAGDRWTIWRESVELIGESPVWGWGPGGFIDAVPRFHGVAWYAANGSMTLESPHNPLLELLADGGVLLLAVVGIGVWLVGRTGWRLRNAEVGARVVAVGAGVALVGGVVAMLAYHATAGPLVLGGVLVGSLISEPATGRSPALAPTGWPVRLAVAVWAAFLAVATIAEWPLAAGVAAARAGAGAAADAPLSLARALRPWDADLASIAAQALSEGTPTGSPEAVALAVAWGGRAVDALPRSIPALEAWAVALERTGDYRTAAIGRGRVVAAAPNDPSARLEYAITLAMAGRPDEALAQAEAALALDPSMEPARTLRVRLCMDLSIPACRP